MRYFIDLAGNYLGQFEGLVPAVEHIEVATPPAHARDIWSGSAWMAGVEVIASVDMASAKLALLEAGHLSTVEGIIDAMPEPQKTAALIEWNNRKTVTRDNALSQAIAAAIPLSDEEMDALYLRASQL